MRRTCEIGRTTTHLRRCTPERALSCHRTSRCEVQVSATYHICDWMSVHEPVQTRILDTGKVGAQSSMQHSTHALNVVLLTQLLQRAKNTTDQRRVVVGVGCRLLPVCKAEVVVQREGTISPLHVRFRVSNLRSSWPRVLYAPPHKSLRFAAPIVACHDALALRSNINPISTFPQRS